MFRMPPCEENGFNQLRRGRSRLFRPTSKPLRGPAGEAMVRRHVAVHGAVAAALLDFGMGRHALTAITGTYHAFDFAKHATRYLAEVQYRFNRRLELRAILGRLAHAAVAAAP